VKLRPDYGDSYLNLHFYLAGPDRDGDCPMAKAIANPAQDAASTLLWATVSTRRLQKDAIAEYERRRGSLANLWLATIWLGPRTSPDVSIRDGTRAIELANRPLRVSAAKILIIYAPSRLLAQGVAVSPRRENCSAGIASSRDPGQLHFGQRTSDEIATLRTRPAIPQVKPGEPSTTGSFLSAVATKPTSRCLGIYLR